MSDFLFHPITLIILAVGCAIMGDVDGWLIAAGTFALFLVAPNSIQEVRIVDLPQPAHDPQDDQERPEDYDIR